MAAVLFSRYYCANWPTKPHVRARILLNLAHDNEAWWPNLHKDKRIMNWQPFMNNVYIKHVCICVCMYIVIIILFYIFQYSLAHV